MIFTKFPHQQVMNLITAFYFDLQVIPALMHECLKFAYWSMFKASVFHQMCLLEHATILPWFLNDLFQKFQKDKTSNLSHFSCYISDSKAKTLNVKFKVIYICCSTQTFIVIWFLFMCKNAKQGDYDGININTLNREPTVCNKQ